MRDNVSVEEFDHIFLLSQLPSLTTSPTKGDKRRNSEDLFAVHDFNIEIDLEMPTTSKSKTQTDCSLKKCLCLLLFAKDTYKLLTLPISSKFNLDEVTKVRPRSPLNSILIML